MNYHFLDVDQWARKDHFHFFLQFEEPFFGVCVEVDCTHAYDRAKAQGHSFFLSYLHKSLVAANAVEGFRYRIDEKQRVMVYDSIDASPTINRSDGTFGFSYLPYKPDFNDFVDLANAEIARVQNTRGLKPAMGAEHVIHYSSIPWLQFKALSHARSYAFKDSIPKISFGKATIVDGRRIMPVSVHVHHALMDAYHVGQFFDAFQVLLDGF